MYIDGLDMPWTPLDTAQDSVLGSLRPQNRAHADAALCQVHRDHDQLVGARPAELGEERGEGVAVPAVADPRDATALVIPTIVRNLRWPRP